MSTSSASLTSKPTLENELSKYSLSPDHVKTKLLKENGDWVQWSSCKLRSCSQKYTGQGDHNTSRSSSQKPSLWTELYPLNSLESVDNNSSLYLIYKVVMFKVNASSLPHSTLKINSFELVHRSS